MLDVSEATQRVDDAVLAPALVAQPEHNGSECLQLEHASQKTPTFRERVHTLDGSRLVFVPGGKYRMGADHLDVEEMPEHAVQLSPFWIGKFPVTNVQYAKFLSHNPGQPTPKFWHDERFNHPAQPVVGVTWNEARDYCIWADLELPSEARWEAAARGPEGRSYPWGEQEPTPDLANSSSADFSLRRGKTSTVGAYPDGAGPFGTLDQAGNVEEWCLDAWDEQIYRKRDAPSTDPVSHSGENVDRVLRGGCWAFKPEFLHCASRDWLGPDNRCPYIGFRVALSC